MFTLAEKICMGIAGVEMVAFGMFAHQCKKGE